MTGLQKALAGLALLAALIGGGTIGTAGIGHKFGLWQMPVARLLLSTGSMARPAARRWAF